MSSEVGIAAVGDWLSLPEVAERLGVEARRARQLLRDRVFIGVRDGRNVLRIPAAFLVPAQGTESSAGGGGDSVVLASLAGTVSVLTDQGFSDEEIIDWLFVVEPAIGCPPIESLLAGRKAEVRRVAQGLG